MIVPIVSFLAGALLFPLLYALLPPFLTSKRRRPEEFVPPPAEKSINWRLREQIRLSLASTTDVAWANVLFQQLYAEMIRNFAYRTRMKNVILKSFAPATRLGIVKSVKISNIDFGCHAPFITSIRVLRPGELESITHAAKGPQVDDEAGTVEELDELSKAFVEHSASVPQISAEAPEVTKAPAAEAGGLFKHKNRTVADLTASTPASKPAQPSGLIEANFSASSLTSSSTSTPCSGTVLNARPCQISENAAEPDAATSATWAGRIEFEDDAARSGQITDDSARAIFDNLIFLLGVEYSDRCMVSLEIELPRKIRVGATITLGSFEGEMLLRVPAQNYSTRYEYAFVRDPNFAIDVTSGIAAGGRRPLFQGSISRFVRRMVGYSFRQTVVYPNWCQQLQGFLPSSRDVEHSMERITPDTIGSAEALGEKILVCLSNDFKILSNSGGICYRQSCNLVNAQHIRQAHFSVPESCAGEPWLAEKVAELGILEGVIARFGGVRVNIDNGAIALLLAVFGDQEYEFVRLIMHGYVIFQRNDPQQPEFIAFTVSNKQLHIFQYGSCADYNLSQRRMARLRSKLCSASEPVPKRGVFSKIISRCRGRKASARSGKEAERGPVADACAVPAQEHALSIEHLRGLFQAALDSAASSPAGRIASAPQSAIEACIRSDSARMRLFSDTASIVRKETVADGTTTTVLEEPPIVTDPASAVRSFAVHTYDRGDCVVDICPEKGVAYIHRCEAAEADAINEENAKSAEKAFYMLQLASGSAQSTAVPSCFVEAVQLQLSKERFLAAARGAPYAVAPVPLKHEQRIQNGALFFEFVAEHEDEFQIKVSGCSTGRTLFKARRVVSRNSFRLLVPTENDIVRISLKPRYKRNKTVQYKLLDMRGAADLFVDGSITLPPGVSFKLALRGAPTHVVFWDRGGDAQVACHLREADGQTAVGGRGILRPESKDYSVVYRNIGSQKRQVDISSGILYLAS
ncbi:hypothetical protein PAPHI01_1229 [Pancytospora philotis]|nr:hypothetical protein PAPHI01_1229 [Pancytospora philotis]